MKWKIVMIILVVAAGFAFAALTTSEDDVVSGDETVPTGYVNPEEDEESPLIEEQDNLIGSWYQKVSKNEWYIWKFSEDNTLVLDYLKDGIEDTETGKWKMNEDGNILMQIYNAREKKWEDYDTTHTISVSEESLTIDKQKFTKINEEISVNEKFSKTA